jgi:hypothetical protein
VSSLSSGSGPVVPSRPPRRTNLVRGCTNNYVRQVAIGLKKSNAHAVRIPASKVATVLWFISRGGTVVYLLQCVALLLVPSIRAFGISRCSVSLTP